MATLRWAKTARQNIEARLPAIEGSEERRQEYQQAEAILQELREMEIRLENKLAIKKKGRALTARPVSP